MVTPGPTPVLSVLRPRLVAAGCAVAVAALSLTSTGARATGTAPGTPVQARAVASSMSTSVTVTWQPAPGPASTNFSVGGFLPDGTLIGHAACSAPCTSMVVPGLTPGATYSFAIWAGNDSGGSAPAGTNPVTVTSGCATSSYCVTADATRITGPARAPGAGLLNSTYGAQPATVAPLAPKAWRVAILPSGPNTYNFQPYDQAKAAGATAITLMLSSAWFNATSSCGALSTTCGAKPPWLDLSGYSRWVSAYVRQIEASGRRPTYWDIQNEPDADIAAGNYFDSAGAATVSPANEMAMFDTAYHAIKSVDPAAKVEGPSLGEFRTSADPQRLDMTTFLSYSSAHALRWDALSWHENGGYLNEDSWSILPTVKIPADVATVKALLVKYPVGSPVLAINEYGTVQTTAVPGWLTSELAGIEAGGVATANRSCFPTQTAPGVDGCNGSPATLDNLLTASLQPGADYQVLSTYAHMTGGVIQSSASDPTVGVLGAIDSNNNLRLLVGRAYTCAAAVNPDCDQPAAWAPAPADIPVAVAVPWTGTAVVSVSRIPDLPGQPVSPVAVQTDVAVPVLNGSVVVTLPKVADGEAYTLTMHP